MARREITSSFVVLYWNVRVEGYLLHLVSFIVGWPLPIERGAAPASLVVRPTRLEHRQPRMPKSHFAGTVSWIYRGIRLRDVLLFAGTPHIRKDGSMISIIILGLVSLQASVLDWR